MMFSSPLFWGAGALLRMYFFHDLCDRAPSSFRIHISSHLRGSMAMYQIILLNEMMMMMMMVVVVVSHRWGKGQQGRTTELLAAIQAA
jgi:hypothetical protein